MSIFAKPAAQDHGNYGPGKQWFLVNSEQLEALILQFSPEIRHDTNLMADMIRSLVDTEREKAGLDNPKGTLTLWPNKDKKGESQPDMLGEGSVAGRKYRLAAWFKGTTNLSISVLPAERK